MRRQIPLAITLIVGLVMVVQYFVPHKPIGNLHSIFNTWAIVIFAFAIILGIGNLIKIHGNRIYRQEKGWGYSVILLLGLAVMIITGVGKHIGPGTSFFYLYWYLYVPMSSSMFALLAFFIASASYRAFRARNFEAFLLLISAVLVMLGRVPAGKALWGQFPIIADWIMKVPNTAGQRAIMIGIALGVVSTSLRIILGIERAHLGGE